MTDEEPKRDSVDVAQRFGVQRFIAELRRIVRVVGFILPTLFIFLKFSVPNFINNSSPSVVMQTATAVWYLSWVLGLGMDLSVQEKVYLVDPDEGRLPREIYLGCGTMLLFALVMMLFIDQPRYFVLCLTAFSMVSMLVFWLFANRASKIIETSYFEFKKQGDRIRIEQLNALKTYTQGRWNKIRAAVLLAMLIPIDILCWNEGARSYVIKAVVAVNDTIKPNALDALLPTLLVILFFVFAEVWQWIRRLEVRFTVAVLMKLGPKLQTTI